MQTFEKRSSVVTQAEMLRWESLSYSFMTELSDDEMDNNSFVVHPLPWRSQSTVILTCMYKLPSFSIYIELNDYIKILDQRLNDKQKKEFCGVVSLKARRVGSPSTQPKPSGPSWAISGIQLFKFPGNHY